MLTGDRSVLDETVTFLEADPLKEDQVEAYIQPKESSESGTILEHCTRAIDRSLELGGHGLPLMGSGDWNDGMNRVGWKGKGESVWLGGSCAQCCKSSSRCCQNPER
jgi:cyclic beta-1,2-glucan synthetase